MVIRVRRVKFQVRIKVSVTLEIHITMTVWPQRNTVPIMQTLQRQYLSLANNNEL